MSDNSDSESIDTEELEKEYNKIHKPSKSKFRPTSHVAGKLTLFNQKMHDKYDIPAREIIIKQLGDFVKEHPNKYKQDLIINSKKCKYKYLELQVCADWAIQFPYKNVWIYARKSTYGSDTLFLTLNKRMDRGYIFDANSIKNVKPRRVRKYSREFAYDVPWNLVMFTYIEDLNKELIESF